MDSFKWALTYASKCFQHILCPDLRAKKLPSTRSKATGQYLRVKKDGTCWRLNWEMDWHPKVFFLKPGVHLNMILRPGFFGYFFFSMISRKRNIEICIWFICIYIYIYILYVNKRVTCWSPHSPLILNNNLSPWVSTLSGDGNGSAKETERSLVVWGWRGDYLLPSDIGITIKDYKDPISNVEHSHPWQHNFLPAPASHA